MMNKIDVIQTPFGDNLCSIANKKRIEFIAKFSGGGIDVKSGKVLLGSPFWKAYEQYGDALSTQLEDILNTNNSLLIDGFTLAQNIPISEGTLSEITSEEAIKLYSSKVIKKHEKLEERIQAYSGNKYSKTSEPSQESIQLDYLWSVYQQSVLQSITNVLPKIDAKDDRCDFYNEFCFSNRNTHLLGISDETMDNNGHGPFQIDVFEVLDAQENTSEIHELTQYTISRIDSVYGSYDTRSGFEELTKKYGKKLELSSVNC